MKEHFRKLAAAAVDASAEMPEAPPSSSPTRTTARRARRAAQRGRKAERNVKREQFEARCMRAAAAAGETYKAPPRTPPRVWAIVRAICNDTKGHVVLSALSCLPLALRHRARELVADRELVKHPTTRYRVAKLVALSLLAGPSRSSKGPRVVAGFCREALAGLIRSPLYGEPLSVSRLFNRDQNAGPILPHLVDLDLVHVEQPGRDAKGVPRGPTGWALNVYYLDGDELADVDADDELAPSSRSSRAPRRLPDH